jgi:2-amino-4-hydroxy-6-hydroxymethyldihydropteridine diphosphokinase
MCNHSILIALGANLPSPAGSPAQTLVAALAMLPEEGLPLQAISRFYRSPAFPAGSGPDYVNACAMLDARRLRGKDAGAVLAALHRVEARLGRVRGQRWGARLIDLDLLAMGQAVLPDPATQAAWRELPLAEQMVRAPETLILPHPRLSERAFVLIPLAEIAPQWRHPATGQSVMQMLDALPDAEKAALAPFVAPFGGEQRLSSPD